jgi:hypothetical protein
MIKNIDILAKFVKGGAEVLQKAINSDEEFNLELIEGSFVSEDDLNTLKETVRNEGKSEWQKIGYDFAMKDLKKDYDLEIEGKDRKKIVDAINKKILADAKREPNEKISELETSLSNLQNQYTTDLAAKDTDIQKLNNQIINGRINNDLITQMPDSLNGIKPQQFTILAKTEYEFAYDDNGQMVVKKGGSVLKDKMEKPLPVKEILTDFATQNNWINASGRGGGHETPGGSSEFKTMNDVFKHMEHNKIDPESTQGQKLIEDFNNSK